MASIAEQEQENPASEVMIIPKFGAKQRSKNKWRRLSKHSSTSPDSPINALDDGCLMFIFSFLSPLPDRYNAALVCHRWRFLACHPHLWLRVDRTINDLTEPGVFSTIDAAVSAAKPGETILISAGGVHITSNIQIKKPLCLIGGGELPEETTLLCSRGSDSALEFLSTCKLTNLTVKAELGCCLLHRSGRLIIDSCVLTCETDPLDFLSCPIVSTATGPKKSLSLSSTSLGDGVTVSCTQIKGGAKAVMTIGTLVLQHVRVIYGHTSVLFWFEIEHQ